VASTIIPVVFFTRLTDWATCDLHVSLARSWITNWSEGVNNLQSAFLNSPTWSLWDNITDISNLFHQDLPYLNSLHPDNFLNKHYYQQRIRVWRKWRHVSGTDITYDGLFLVLLLLTTGFWRQWWMVIHKPNCVWSELSQSVSHESHFL
jgi:hypothetical protein